MNIFSYPFDASLHSHFLSDWVFFNGLVCIHVTYTHVSVLWRQKDIKATLMKSFYALMDLSHLYGTRVPSKVYAIPSSIPVPNFINFSERLSIYRHYKFHPLILFVFLLYSRYQSVTRKFAKFVSIFLFLFFFFIDFHSTAFAITRNVHCRYDQQCALIYTTIAHCGSYIMYCESSEGEIRNYRSSSTLRVFRII